MANNPAVSIIVPLYNEEKVYAALISRLTSLLDTLPFSVETVLVDDGSKDSTALLMRQSALKDPRFKAVFLSRNYGHQLAVSAGMAQASATDAVMIIDGDLQDPPELISTFYEKIKEGYDIVFAVRQKRKENFFKKFLYWSFYRFLRFISEVDLPLDSGDFCMMSKRVNNVIVGMPEQSRFIRGMRSWVGFKQIGIPYERNKREAGEPKYTLKHLFRLAYDGIFNFSYVPLKVITRLGIYSITIALTYLSYVFYKKIMGFPLPSGFTAIIVSITLFSGVQLLCIGIIGEYVARIYMQVKNRPLYIIRSIIENRVEK